MVLNYQGSKKRFADDIYVVIKQYVDAYNSKYPSKKLKVLLSPFFGMGNVEFKFAENDNMKVIGNDINKDIILMWDGLKKGTWTPPKDCSKAKFTKLKKSKENSAERGYCLTTFSYGGIFNSTYRPDYQPVHMCKTSTNTMYRKLLSKIPTLKQFTFSSGTYSRFNPKNMLIYCDPPYISTISRSNKFLINFNITEFWDIMRIWSKHNLVFISEEQAPKDFTKVWEKQCIRHVNNSYEAKQKKLKRKERLFLHNDWVKRLHSKLSK